MKTQSAFKIIALSVLLIFGVQTANAQTAASSDYSKMGLLELSTRAGKGDQKAAEALKRLLNSDAYQPKLKKSANAPDPSAPVLGATKGLGISAKKWIKDAPDLEATKKDPVTTIDGVEDTQRRLRSIIARIKVAKEMLLAGKGGADFDRELRELQAEFITISQGKPYKKSADSIGRGKATVSMKPTKPIKVQYSNLDKTELISLAKSGNPDAQVELAKRLKYGTRGINKDVGNSFLWLMEAAKNGHAQAQYDVSLSYSLGNGVESSDEKALIWLRRSADSGYAAAQYSMFETYWVGVGVSKSSKEAKYWAIEAYAQKDKLSDEMRQQLLEVYKFDTAQPMDDQQSAGAPVPQTLGKSKGLRLRAGKPAKNPARDSSYVMRRLAEILKESAGIEAKVRAGIAKLEAGDTSAEGRKESLRLNKRTKELNAEVEVLKAIQTVENIGKQTAIVKQNVENTTKAVASLKFIWMMKPAELMMLANNGDPKAQAELASRYDKGGNGFKKDPIAAFEWMLKASNNGDASAQYSTSVDYYLGKGVAKDKSKAAFWLRKSAENGNNFAQFDLHQELEGRTYFVWGIFEKNLKEAEYWLDKAAAQGFLVATEHKKEDH